jgi:hypothetical protein
MKYLIGITFIFILGALGSAGFFMLRRTQGTTPKNKRMARALAVRVGLSVLVFALILIGYQLGWLEPTGIKIATKP